jgi:hypothetical protein
MLLASLLVAAAVAQAESRPADARGSEPAATAAVGFPAVTFSDEDAKKALAEFKGVSGKAPLVERMAALDSLVRGSHASLVAVLDKLVRRDSAMAVRKKAAEALAWQPHKQAYPAVCRLLDSSEVTDNVELLAPLVTALAHVGYKSKDWKPLESLFRAGYAPERTGMQRAIIQLAGQHKETQAVALLLENLDEPIPVDVHGASNPPAEYWEARWKAWRSWREDVRTTLQKITGQKFGSAEEARAWLKVNGAKLKITSF